MSKYMRGFIFDFNGTLFRDGDKHILAWKNFAKVKCNVELSEKEYAENLEGRNDRHAIRYLMKRDVAERELSELTEEKEAMYRDYCFKDREHMKLTEGAKELFDFLLERNIPRTIATASCRSNVDFYVKEFELDKWFDASKIIFDDGSIPGKPKPDFYLRASAIIDVPPSCCVVAEDSNVGVQSAISAGIGYITLLVPKGKKSAFDSIDSVSSIISDFNEFDRNLFSK